MDTPPKRLAALMAQLAEKDVTPLPEKAQERAETLRQMRSDYARKRASGELAPLKRDPVTGKRPVGTGRHPRSGWLTPHLKPSDVPAVDNSWRHRSRRERANELQERMAAFSGIRNAAWHVRDAYFLSDDRRHRAVRALIVAFFEALKSSDDYEAAAFALADALYASKLGVPWEP